MHAPKPHMESADHVVDGTLGAERLEPLQYGETSLSTTRPVSSYTPL